MNWKGFRREKMKGVWNLREWRINKFRVCFNFVRVYFFLLGWTSIVRHIHKPRLVISLKKNYEFRSISERKITSFTRTKIPKLCGPEDHTEIHRFNPFRFEFELRSRPPFANPLDVCAFSMNVVYWSCMYELLPPFFSYLQHFSFHEDEGDKIDGEI